MLCSWALFHGLVPAPKESGIQVPELRWTRTGMKEATWYIIPLASGWLVSFPSLIISLNTLTEDYEWGIGGKQGNHNGCVPSAKYSNGGGFSSFPCLIHASFVHSHSIVIKQEKGRDHPFIIMVFWTWKLRCFINWELIPLSSVVSSYFV